MGAVAYWQGLSQGQSAVRRIQSFDPSGLQTQIAAEIDDFDPRQYVEKQYRKSLKLMVRTVQLAVAGARLAFDDAGLDAARLDVRRFGVAFGAGTIPGEPAELGPAAQACSDGTPDRVDYRGWAEKGLPLLPPTWMLNHVPNMPAGHVSILHNAQGPNNTITQTDAASLLAVGEAVRSISRGHADLFLAGGADAKVNPISLVRHGVFGRLSRRNGSPEKACRPFDLGRDGTVLGEGAGVLIVEAEDHARRRGARIYAEVAGFASAFDREGDGRGLARAVRAALAEAGIGPADVDHVNAQGYGTPADDAREARGLHEVFGEYHPAVPVVAFKGYFGNLGAAAGTTELIGSLLPASNGPLPATLNHDDSDPECPLTVALTPRERTHPFFLKVSSTELGQCAALVCRVRQ